MKLKWESISTLHQNVFLAKVLAAIFITGLAFRFYAVRFGQVSVNGISDPQISPPSSVIISENEDLFPIDIEVEKCDLFTGKWIRDPLGPIYTNGSCGVVVDSHQNCITNGRPDSGFLYWKWKPNDCSLPRFDPLRFLHLMSNKSWAFIGDSISRNHVESLLCILSTVERPVEVYHDEEYRSKRWVFPSYNMTVSNIWSPFLVQAAIFEDSRGVSSAAVQLHLDRLDNTWTDLFPGVDYAIISSGEWFLKTAIYHENATPVGCHGCPQSSNITDLGFDYAYNTSLRHVMDFVASSNTKGTIFFRTSIPDHFENGEWHNGGTCKKTEPVNEDEVEMKVLNKILRDVEISQYQRVVTEMGEEAGRFKLLDFAGMLLTRPDGHPGPYREFRPFDKDKNAKVQNDCLHWCLPGPIDHLNDVILEIILNS
ncbi:Protein trichome birefringence-like 23 [Raphanus sativus]|uniref:Protein trichome birefringence-like 23 n=1 Tax=Raphanus sativus TaxID=3726 RepID=A0A6J0KZI5_RAPSA|nr:protein trichome birefringence-like 23 [Raphanus sativus]KAJ4876249.1 Protein trichome birefringence-like 23 [Raphanus sativus]